MKTLKIEELSKNFGSTEVLRKINLEIDEGNFLVLLGPSGCGKSTLLNIIAGLETINEGNVFIDDYNVSKVEPKDRNIAMVFQSYALYPSMNVRENMIFGLKQAKTSKEKIEEQLEKVSKFLQVDQLLERKPSQLSGGQRQRVAMGRALVRDPKVFLFDEPLSNLDAKLRAHMRLEIRKLHNQQNATTIYVTHDQIEAMTMADEIVIMNGGIIEQIASPNDIYEKPNNLFVADFIGSPAINLIKGEVTDRGSIKLKSQELPHQKNNLSPNQKVVYGIRPTDVKIVDNSNVKAEVILVETTGSETHIIAMLDDNEFRIVQAGGRTSIKNGEKVSLEFDISKAHTFDQTTTKRID